MNFVFAIGYYRDNIDANCKIAATIARQLISFGNKCELITYSFDVDSAKEISYQDVKIKVLPANSRSYESKQKLKGSGLSKSLFTVLHPIDSLKIMLSRKHEYEEVIGYINSLIDRETYLIGFINPTDVTYRILNETNECRKVVYQLDPWGLFETEDKTRKENSKKKELELFRKCCHIFTTDILYRQYSEEKDYNQFISKIDPLNIPNLCISESKNKGMSFDPDDYNILYLGTLDDDVRNPIKTLSIFGKMIEANQKIKLFFIGNINSRHIDEYSKKYKNNIFILPSVKSEIAQTIMNLDGIFLLNINNDITNMSPSKLIDYISTGNPIINVIKNTEDASFSILEKYDNQFSFHENDNVANELVEFITENKGKKIDRETIRDSYYEYAPEYIASRMVEILLRNEDSDE